MSATLKSMGRVPRTHVKKVFVPSNADHADQTTLDDHEVISPLRFTPVQDAPDKPGPLRTIADRIADQRPPTWDELSALRWGPAMDEDRPWVPAEDDEPGIVIDIPDRGRMLAALRSRLDGGRAR